MTDWNSLNSPDDWLTELQSLLASAEDAAQEAELSPRLTASRKLNEFIANSPPGLPYDKMDRIASQTGQALLMSSIDDRVAAIVARTSDYHRLAKAIRSATDESRTVANVIGLVRIRRVAEDAGSVVDSVKAVVKDLRDQGAAPEAERLEGLLSDAMSLIDALRAYGDS